MVVPPCRRLWDPRMSRLTPGPRRSPGRRSGDPQLSKKWPGSPVGDLTYRDPHLGQSSPGTPGCRAGTPRWYSTKRRARRSGAVSGSASPSPWPSHWDPLGRVAFPLGQLAFPTAATCGTDSAHRGASRSVEWTHGGGDSLAPLDPSPLARRPRRARLAPATCARRGRLALAPLPRAPPLPLRSLPTLMRK